MFAHKMKFILIQCVAVILLIFLTVIRETRCADDNLSPRSEANPVSVKILEEGTKKQQCDTEEANKCDSAKNLRCQISEVSGEAECVCKIGYEIDTGITDYKTCTNLNIDELQRTKTQALKEVGWFALKTVGISAAVLGGVSLAAPAMGFTAAGVAAGSLATSLQSGVIGGTVASGSAIAVLQSVGAAGLAASTQAAVFIGSAVVAGVHTFTKYDNDFVRECYEDEKETCNLKKNSVCKISEENKPECICMEPYEEIKDEGYKTIC